jgi:Domain of unknown function (DUF4331)
MTIAWITSRRTLIAAGLAAALAVLLASVFLSMRTAPTAAGAADHLDAPGLTPPSGDIRTDITDVYAFRAPSGRTVLVMNVNGLTKKGVQARLATGVPSVAATKRASYNFRIDSNGDAKEDVVLSLTFGTPNAQGVQGLTLRRNGKVFLEGATSPYGKLIVNRGSAHARVYVGMRDDPFFFDLDGFLEILSKEPGKSFLGCKSPRKDFFAGSNVTSIVVEMDSAQLTKGKSMIGVWATTNKGSAQIDRMGRPAVATVFVPNNPFEPKGSEPSKKNTYNHTKPSADREAFRGEVVDSLKVLFSLNDASGDNKADDAGKIDGLADVLLPDILTFDTAKSQGFLNGRRPADDVIDAELNLITEGAATTDCVSKNDKAFSNAFPYLAAPHS